MPVKKVSLKQGVDFHGHLGPYLVLGIIAGETALKILKCRKYFGLNVNVWGADKKPKSCLVDGLQLSTGATYGKGNINKFDGTGIKIQFQNQADQRALIFRLNSDLIKRLEQANSHHDSEALAKELYRTGFAKLFDVNFNPYPLSRKV